MNSLKSAARKNSNVYIFDPFDKFCDAKYCYVTRENVSLFIDDNHFKDGAFDFGRSPLDDREHKRKEE